VLRESGILSWITRAAQDLGTLWVRDRHDIIDVEGVSNAGCEDYGLAALSMSEPMRNNVTDQIVTVHALC